MYEYVYMDRVVGWVLWHINLCRLFNTKFCLYVYTFNQRFLNEYLLVKIFYKEDFICLQMIYMWIDTYVNVYVDICM